MKKQRLQAQHPADNLRLWSNKEVKNVLPLLIGIIRSLRENWLDMHRSKLQLQRIDTRAGRPNRRALIQRQEAFWEAEQAEAKFNESLDELGELGVFCLDPVAGQALIPFLNEDSLAWYVFDLFSPTGISAWRLHGDPLETRRPLQGVLAPALPFQE